MAYGIIAKGQGPLVGGTEVAQLVNSGDQIRPLHPIIDEIGLTK